jgi:6-phospho-beta-glucosidase
MEMVVSTLNNGAISDLPDDCVVEISSIITAHGPEPFNWGHFDYNARGQLQLQKAMEECTIEAAVTGDYGKALQAFTMNPLIPGGRSAKELLDEMLAANSDYLPQFSSIEKKI